MKTTSIRWMALVSFLLAGCVAPAKVGMKPAEAERGEVRWWSGAPIVRSSGKAAAVAVSPLADASGRHEVGARITFFVLVQNVGGAPWEVPETSVSIAANGGGVLVYPGATVDEALRASAPAARTADAVASAFLGWDAGGASGAAPPPAGDAASLARIHGALQRVTVPPGALAGGFVVADVPRERACAEHTPTGSRSGLCRFTVLVQVAGESHAFTFEEAR